MLSEVCVSLGDFAGDYGSDVLFQLRVINQRTESSHYRDGSSTKP
jgi:hypothetical protein